MSTITIKPANAASRPLNPFRAACLLLVATSGAFAQNAGSQVPDTKSSNAEYADFYTGQSGSTTKGIDWVQAISVTSPPYCSDIRGDVTVNFTAPGMTKVEVLCWQQPTVEKT